MSAQDATIYDVAERAGVSISTVSNVINRPTRVADATRRRVLAVADELGYLPKADAASLARRRSQRIAVIAPFTAYASFMERLKGVLLEAAAAGLEVAIFDTESAATAASPLLGSLPLRGHFDGVMVMGTRIEPEVENRLVAQGLPTVVVDSSSDRFPEVLCDDEAGGALAAQYLYHLGHRVFGYVAEMQVADYDSQSIRRLTGFRRRLSELRNCDLEVVEVATSSTSVDIGVGHLLDGGFKPTAIMAHYDDLAVDVLAAVRRRGISVPRDISVMGCDDGALAFGAGLTTLHQPLQESGSVATRVLMASMVGAVSRTRSFLDQTVIARDTTAPPHPAI